MGGEGKGWEWDLTDMGLLYQGKWMLSSFLSLKSINYAQWDICFTFYVEDTSVCCRSTSYTLITNPATWRAESQQCYQPADCCWDTSFILFLFFPSAIRERERERAQIGVWLRQKSESWENWPGLFSSDSTTKVKLKKIWTLKCPSVVDTYICVCT